MGTWGAGLFSDDTALDVKDDFRTYIGDGLTPEEATAALLKEWEEVLADEDEGPVFWLALAATQWALGRLVPSVRERAMQVLDLGGDLHRWEHDSKALKQRKAALDKLQKQLEAPMPAPKKVPRRFRDSNDWAVGSVHAYRLKNAEWCLFRVIGHHTDKGGTSPIVEVLDWSGPELPSEQEIRALSVREHRYSDGHDLSYLFRGISQLWIGATSRREFPAARLKALDIITQPQQKPRSVISRWEDLFVDRVGGSVPQEKPGGCAITSWRYLTKNWSSYLPWVLEWRNELLSNCVIQAPHSRCASVRV